MSFPEGRTEGMEQTRAISTQQGLTFWLPLVDKTLSTSLNVLSVRNSTCRKGNKVRIFDRGEVLNQPRNFESVISQNIMAVYQLQSLADWPQKITTVHDKPPKDTLAAR